MIRAYSRPVAADDARGRRLLAVLTLAVALIVAPPVWAQDEVEDEGTTGPTEQDFRDIDEILAQDEEALYTSESSLYDSGGRRDPFRSLLRRSEPEGVAQVRPEGIAGLLISDLRLEGVFLTAAGPVAQVEAASDQISYLLRPGDELWDGDVVNVTINEIVFKQKVEDPTALKPFREVVMRLYQPQP